ncbi:MAG: hypothetical protein II797_04520, partial [Clostridia bacterium]|nr:hypothetical protein [Clostridia bacterium]
MGNGFTIVLNGSSSIGQLIVWGAGYGGSVKLTGSGSLSLNSNSSADIGLYLKAEWSQTVLMIDNTVTLESYGRFAAVLVESSSVKQGISYLHPLRLHWTKRISGDFMGARYYQYRNSEGVVTEERSMTLEEVKKETGKQYYDSTLAYEDGTIVTYVYFSQSSS